MIFVDSNVPMYVAGREHANRGPAQRFLERAKGGALQICTSTEVLQEILYRYVGLGQRSLSREVYHLFVELCPVVLPVTLADMDRACDLACLSSDVSVRDAVHAAVMLNNEVDEIATFDTGFDKLAGLRRFPMP